VTGDNALSDTLAALEAAQIMPAKPVNLPAAAHYYVTTLRWPVFPLKARGKTPLTTNGFKGATLDPEQIRRWWTTHEDANIGLPTGPVESGGCGYDVIDADGPEGVAAWTQLKHRHCPPGCSTEAFCDARGGFDIRAEAFTPGNATVGRGPGRHIYLPATGRGNAARINGQPIDVRGTGGYVVGVPSLNLIGAAYTWLRPPAVPGA
jgi:hypothetical protein